MAHLQDLYYKKQCVFGCYHVIVLKVLYSCYHGALPKVLCPIGHGGYCHHVGQRDHRCVPGKKILNGQWPSVSSIRVLGQNICHDAVLKLVVNLLWFLSACLCNALVIGFHAAMSPSHAVSSGDPSMWYRPF